MEIYLICCFSPGNSCISDSFAAQFTKCRSLKKNQEAFSVGQGKEASPWCREHAFKCWHCKEFRITEDWVGELYCCDLWVQVLLLLMFNVTVYEIAVTRSQEAIFSILLVLDYHMLLGFLSSWPYRTIGNPLIKEIFFLKCKCVFWWTF
jgi:hypothetical protein